MGNGNGGGTASSSQSWMRPIAAWSTVAGVAPVPKAALRLRSLTSTLLPVQCSIIGVPSSRCLRLRWFQIDGQSVEQTEPATRFFLDRGDEDVGGEALVHHDVGEELLEQPEIEAGRAQAHVNLRRLVRRLAHRGGMAHAA